MAATSTANYPIEGRELIAQSEGLRVQVLTLAAGQSVPWHHHTQIADTFFCLEGPMVVETREPDGVQVLQPGDRFTAAVGQPHYVHGLDDGFCKFVIVQGVGVYDYIPESP